MSILTFVFASAVLSQAPTGPVPPSVDPMASCKICHADVVKARAAKTDVHADLDCTDCHPGRGFNPHEPPDVDPDTKAAAKIFAARGALAPVAFTSCGNCHPDVMDTWRGSVHGQAVIHGKAGPLCTDCHGSPHTIQPVKKVSKMVMAGRCVKCHAFADSGTGAKPADVVDTYRDTIHGKMVHLGNNRAASCADCHNAHAVYAVNDPRSSVNIKNRVHTCAKCHKDATASFAMAISHVPHRESTDFASWIVAIGFSLLTVGTILLLFLHIILDFVRTGRRALEYRKNPPQHSATGPVAADAQVPRFDNHMRAQHIGLMVSFTTLVVTGWPLKAARVGTSSVLAHLLGGQAVLAIIHRSAGTLLLTVALYHLIYILVMAKKNKLTWQMLPYVTDVVQAYQNILYMLGLRKERPAFGRWAYHEKFDYWAVFWGMAIMGGSGLILWFPVAASHLLPGKVIAIAQIAHSDEALLALLAIFLWHFYNVHLRPTVFPMSWVWLTGKISAEQLYEEHRGEYERLYGKEPPAAPEVPPGWTSAHRWSFLALGVIVVAAGVVLLGNFESVRNRIAALTTEQPAKVAATVQASVLPQINGKPVMAAFHPGFNAFTECFNCHNKKRFETGGGGFPHKMHFDDIGVDKNCKGCHEAKWHQSMKINTQVCLNCHEPKEIGLFTKK